MYQKRLEPLGASTEDLTEFHCHKCICLEEEKDLLQSSLFALTTHFAQVQFRLRQLVNAKFENQEELVCELEEFAFSNITLKEDSDKVVKRNEQKLLLDQLKNQIRELRELNRNENVTWSQLLKHVQSKEEMELQLKKQIEDLERFSQDLRNVRLKCDCKRNQFGSYFIQLIDKSFSFLQMLILLRGNCFSRRHNDWSDLRAKLELSIIDIKTLLHCRDNSRITTIVRKSLATSIRDLMQHGTKSNFFNRLSEATHGWDIILYYYNFKKGPYLNSSTIRTLSRSFNLSIAGASPKMNRRNLLYVIEDIISTHSRYKRSSDSQFKAFVCAGLNAKRLVAWLNLIFHCGSVIETFYYPWSYVATTKYQDGLRSLDVLTPHKFDLPVDFDVKMFEFDESLFA